MPSRIKRLVCSTWNKDLAILLNLVFFGSPSIHTSVDLITYPISGDCYVSCNGSVIVKVILCLGRSCLRTSSFCGMSGCFEKLKSVWSLKKLWCLDAYTLSDLPVTSMICYWSFEACWWDKWLFIGRSVRHEKSSMVITLVSIDVEETGFIPFRL